MVPALFFFDDYFWTNFFDEKLCRELISHREHLIKKKLTVANKLRTMCHLAVYMLIMYLSIPIVKNMASRHQVMNTSFDPFRIVNTYGAFGSVSRERLEVVLMGTSSLDPSDLDATQWKEYEFHCKPGNVTKTPCLISPYHYRLDWLMWFLAFQPYQHNPWLLHLMGKLLF
jgi:hypothetical protein